MKEHRKIRKKFQITYLTILTFLKKFTYAKETLVPKKLQKLKIFFERSCLLVQNDQFLCNNRYLTASLARKWTKF